MYRHRNGRQGNNFLWLMLVAPMAVTTVVVLALVLFSGGSPHQEPAKASPTPVVPSAHCPTGASVLDAVKLSGVSHVTPMAGQAFKSYCRATIGFTAPEAGATVKPTPGCEGCVVAVVHDVTWPGYSGRAVFLSTAAVKLAPSTTDQGTVITPIWVELFYPIRLVDSSAAAPNPAALKSLFDDVDVLAASGPFAPGVSVSDNVVLAVQSRHK